MQIRVLMFPLCAVFAAILNSCSPSGTEEETTIPNRISYNFDIRPIFSDKCFICHGPDANKRQAGLRLDIAENAYKALDENPGAHAIVPGDPMQSQVFLRISSEDSTFRMPPAGSNLSLTSREIAVIRK